MVEFENIWDLLESPLEFLNLSKNTFISFSNETNGEITGTDNYLFEMATEFDRRHIGEHSVLAHDQPSVLKYEKVAFDAKQIGAVLDG